MGDYVADSLIRQAAGLGVAFVAAGVLQWRRSRILGWGAMAMRRIIIPLVFVALLTIAAVMPVVADGGDAGDSYPKVGCEYSA